MPKTSLDALNRITADAFVATIGEVAENAPWIARAAAAHRPFATVADLHAALIAAVRQAAPDRQLAFLRGHPELAGKIARKGAMTEASIAEQGSLGLDRLSDDDFHRFERLNAAYRARFGFPFILCVRRHSVASILDDFERRQENPAPVERAAAIAEIGHIMALRLAAAIAD